MRKSLLLTFLVGLTCFSAAGFVACEETVKNEPLFEDVLREDLELSYDHESGVLSWNAVVAAKSYTVSTVGRFEDSPTVQETSETSVSLTLKAGNNKVSVTAIDAGDNQIAAGTITVELQYNFGSPKKPQNLVFDEETNTLSWDPSAGAVKYLVVGDAYDGDEDDFTTETTQTQYVSSVTFESGIYTYSVAGIGENGAVGEAAVFELRSYYDENFNKQLPDGTYNLIDFEDDRAIEILRYSDYIEPAWLGWNEATEIVSYSVTSEGETPLKGEKFLKIVKEGTTIAFGGVEISFPEPVEIGTLYFDLIRTGGDGCGVMVKDENGNCATAIGLEWGTEGYEETGNKWATFAFPLDHLRNSYYSFSKVKSVTLYARAAKTGTFSIDNVRYDKTNVGLPGANVSYRSELQLLTWDAVPYAREYELKIGDEIYTSRTNIFTFPYALPIGENEVEITAKNGESARSKSYTVEAKPVAPRNLTYEDGTVAFDAVEGAEYYHVRVDANGKLRYEAQTRKCSMKVSLPVGLYEISVNTVAKGVYSEKAAIEYCSYVDPDFKKDLGDGTKRLLDFESEEILMTACASDYVEWGSKAAVNVAYSLTNNAVEFTHTSNALLLDNTANASSTVFGGVTFTFPEEVRFGTLYVDICRFSGDGCGVMIEDEKGNCVPLFPLEWGSEYYTETSEQFYTLTITLSEVRKNAPRFSRIKKITFYVRSAKGGKFLFDNVRYDDVNMGFLGEVYYDEYQNALTWDEVTNAKKYELLIDGKTATTYTNEFLADDEFSIGKHTVTIKAMNGSMMREKTYAVDIGPSAPEVSYDKTTNTLSWREAFGATSYEIVVKNWNTDETVFTQTTSITSVVLDGAYEGVYSIFVYALSADGARSKPCSLAFRTVSDGEIGIGATLENGKYKLFDFESTTALLIARDSDYIDWQWNGSPTLIKIPYKIEDGVLWISQQSDGKMHYGGVTFEVENAIEISGFGFSHKRISGDGAGVVVEDEKGNKVRLLGYEWSEDADSDYQKTKGEWVEYSFTIEQIREICEEFGKLKSVTFYAHASRYGEYLFDNVYYF